jgi:hypothetical protein
MAKPMLVTLPCVLLLLDVWPLRRVTVGRAVPVAKKGSSAAPVAKAANETWSRVLLEKLPFFALVVASAIATYQVQQAGGAVSAALDFGARLGNAVIAVVRYLWKFVLPIDLAVLYPHPGAWPVRQVVAALVVVAGLSAVAVWQWRRRPWVAIGWCWFLGTLVPVAGLVQVGLQSMADRYTYLTMFGVQVRCCGRCAT